MRLILASTSPARLATLRAAGIEPVVRPSSVDEEAAVAEAGELSASETVLLLAEVYRRGDTWKLRALGQGYAEGLAGIARDYGVEVEDDGGPAAPAPSPPPPPGGRAPAAPPRSAPPPAGGVRAAGPEGYAALVNAERIRAGAPEVAVDERLAAAASRHAAAMAAHGELAVETPDGVTLYQRVSDAGFACLALSGAQAAGEGVRYKAHLDGASEVPKTESKGTGDLTATYDPATKRLTWNGSYSGLTGPVTAAHFHGPAKSG